ncbi:hypothetical protein Y032_0013g2110 [Ancylostoma ceylanicum]|nr:hypothetical protein Y032_0013g2110 [Ancylostoma ceylanicum]
MAEASERILLDAVYCASTIEDEEYIEENKIDVDWDKVCENIETRSSPWNTPFIEFGSKPIPIEQFEVEVCKTKREDGIQTLKPLPTSLLHYPLGHPTAAQ